MPFFVYKGQLMGNIAAFKQHCSLGFFGPAMAEVLKKDGLGDANGMGSLGKITSVKDLPADKILVGYVRQAAALIDGGKTMMREKKAAKPAAEVPAELTVALKKNKAAAKVFAEFSPSCKREYVEWIAEAKRAETKEKRVAQAVEWIAEGKQRHWKYQNC
jgi:uncharacterized protein YdeI (YjbR/CyaY-like superfamily)